MAIQFKRGQSAQIPATAVLASGQPGLEFRTDKSSRLKVGDGTKQWSALPYLTPDIEIYSDTGMLNSNGRVIAGWDSTGNILGNNSDKLFIRALDALAVNIGSSKSYTFTEGSFRGNNSQSLGIATAPWGSIHMNGDFYYDATDDFTIKLKDSQGVFYFGKSSFAGENLTDNANPVPLSLGDSVSPWSSLYLKAGDITSSGTDLIVGLNNEPTGLAFYIKDLGNIEISSAEGGANFGNIDVIAPNVITPNVITSNKLTLTCNNQSANTYNSLIWSGLYTGVQTVLYVDCKNNGAVVYPQLGSISAGQSFGKIIVNTLQANANLSGNVTIMNNFIPYNNSTSTTTGITLGDSTHKWRYLYAYSGTIQTSSKDDKTNIHYLSADQGQTTMKKARAAAPAITYDDIVEFVQTIEPATFTYLDGDVEVTEETSAPEMLQLGLIAEDLLDTKLYKYIGIDKTEEIVDEETGEVSQVNTKGLKTLPLAVTALACCKYLINKVNELSQA